MDMHIPLGAVRMPNSGIAARWAGDLGAGLRVRLASCIVGFGIYNQPPFFVNPNISNSEEGVIGAGQH